MAAQHFGTSRTPLNPEQERPTAPARALERATRPEPTKRSIASIEQSDLVISVDSLHGVECDPWGPGRNAIPDHPCKTPFMKDEDVEDAHPNWMLNELNSAGAENVDPAHVARYDDKEDASAAAEVALLQQHGLNDESTVLDLGAGTGQFALAAAPLCASVTAVDVSPVMLDRLRAKAAQASVTNLHVVEAGFLSYQHENEPVDFVYSRWALHHLPDFWKALALARIRPVLRSGGVFRLLDIV